MAGYLPILGQSYGGGSRNLSWFCQCPDVVRRPSRLTSPEWEAVEPFTETLVAETITPDKWYQQHPEPVPRRPRPPHRWEVKPLEPSLTEEPPALSWWQPASEPVRQWPRLVPEGFTVKPLDASLTEAPPPLSWWQPASEPVWQGPRLVPEGATVKPLEPSLVLTIDLGAWHLQNPDPVRRQVAVVEGSVPYRFFEAIFLGHWFEQPPGPIPPSQLVPEGLQVEPLSSPELESAGLSWVQPMSLPVLPVPPRLPGLVTPQIVEPTLIIEPPPLSWWQPASERLHVFPPREQGWFGPTMLEPVLFEPFVVYCPYVHRRMDEAGELTARDDEGGDPSRGRSDETGTFRLFVDGSMDSRRRTDESAATTPGRIDETTSPRQRLDETTSSRVQLEGEGERRERTGEAAASPPQRTEGTDTSRERVEETDNPRRRRDECR